MIRLLIGAFLLLAVGTVHSQTNFYQGKTITIIVGTKAGDAYDLYPRLLAEFLPKYIPGNPSFIVQNMPGAASLIAANHLFKVTKPDGLTIGAIYPALYFEQLTKKPQVQFDWTKFGWIGSPVKSNHMLYMRSDAPYKSMDDIKNAKTPPKCGASGVTSTGNYLPKLMEEILGTKFEIVLGYQTGQDVDLAVERGEIVCRAFTITAYRFFFAPAWGNIFISFTTGWSFIPAATGWSFIATPTGWSFITSTICWPFITAACSSFFP